MRKKTLLLAATLISTNVFCQLTYNWIKTLNNSDVNGKLIRGIEASNNGNIYIMGYFSSTTDFDPSSSNYFLSPNISNSCFLAKYTNNGDFIWAKEIIAETVNNGYEAVNDFVIDSNENIYITGSYEQIVDFDPSPATYTLSAITTINNYTNYNRFAFTAKYNSSGDLVWVKDIKRATDKYTDKKIGIGIKIELDGNNNVYIGAQVVDRPFFCKYNDAGKLLWQDSLMTSTKYSAIAKLSGFFVSSSGDVYVGGWFNDDIDMNPGVAVNTMYATSAIFLGKYNSNGEFIWGKKLNKNLPLEIGILDIVTDPLGNIYTCGTGSSGVSYRNQITKWDINGNLQWINFFHDQVQTILGNGCTDISISCNNELIVTGYVNDSYSFNRQNYDPLGGTYTCTPNFNSTTGLSTGSSFAFVASYNTSNGGIKWAKSVGGNLNSPSIVDINNFPNIPSSNSFIDKSGNIYLFGNLLPINSTTGIPINDFDPNAGLVELNSSTDKSFFAKYISCGTTILNENNHTNIINTSPNPSLGEFNFKGLVGENIIHIIDIAGRILITEKTFTDNHTLNLDLSKGVYFYRITDKYNRVSQGKLILH